LEALRIGMETQERTVGELEVLVLQSLALRQLGTTDEAMATFEQALRLAEPEGYVRIFGDHGAAMLQLLRDADRKGIGRDYVRVLLRAFQSDEQKEVSAGGLLNEQEKAILRLIASGHSNREISEELYLSLNTIKWYSSQIYGKLGVSSRAEAVERAHDLNIL
jgi:LuxR family maltose regulon positive regulatory protein